ncbi:E3 ubiquitin-protein ligase, putative [Plasmodium chabaudi chabaudi]|uniref:RING-type E3 ubiquitin transferase n=1 Tax=Plasmodium chabaudi chabaudi TaxID=31271 RepID=A0A1C6X574_PLACU|nr:E3 ubiquitin-protein ligase, putative [Plasmodium chabaudi chabaudi]
MNNDVERREGEEEEDPNDVFLYSNETNQDSEFCNVLCMFIFFMALFIIMVTAVDNTVPSNNNNDTSGHFENGNFESRNISNNLSTDEVINNFLDNAIIQSFDFKGVYKIKRKYNSLQNVEDDYMNIKSIKEDDQNFEGKIVTLKLALQNVTKSFLFLHFYPTNVNVGEVESDQAKAGVKKEQTNGGVKKEQTNGGAKNVQTQGSAKNSWTDKGGANYNLIHEKRNKENEKKFEYIGMIGVNVNGNKNYIFNGSGYNISTFCKNESETNCICNYTANIKQNTKINQLTSAREIEESYFYSLKKYIIDEQTYFNNNINEKYKQYYKKRMEAISSYVDSDGDSDSDNGGASHLGPSSGEEGIKNDEANYHGVLSSSDCNIEISLEGYDEDNSYFSRKVTNFVLMFNIKSLIELGLFYKQIKNSENMRNTSKVSIISICLNSYIEIFESLLLLYQVLFSKLLLTSYMAMIILKFLLYTFMEIRYILIIWKANNSHHSANNNWEYMQRQLSILYKYYYSFVLLLIAIFYYIFPYFPYLILLIYLCWVPQICLDIWKGQHKSISLNFVFLLSICRIFLPVYIFLYPYNIFQLDIFSNVGDLSNSTFSFLIIFFISLQLLFMYAQRIYGPRYFFNTSLLPHVHNYYQNLDPNFEAGIPECVICMYNIILNNTKYCVTPCYHIFHEKCLQQWMNIKMECPTCRGPLPNFP